MIKRNETVAYVESPLQMTSLAQYMEYENTYANVMVRLPRLSVSSQLCEAKKNLDYLNPKVIFVATIGLRKCWDVFFGNFVVLWGVYRSRTFVIGDVRSALVRGWIWRILRRRAIVVIDDGLYIVRYIEALDHENVTFFSALPLSLFKGLKSARVVSSRERLRGKPTKQCVFFVGQPICSNGIVDLDIYERAVHSEVLRYEGYDIYYFPHRNETEDQLSRLADIGVKIINPHASFEKYFDTIEFHPEFVIGFFSTVLANITDLAAVKIRSIRLPNSAYSKSNLKYISKCYQFFADIGIQIEDSNV